MSDSLRPVDWLAAIYLVGTTGLFFLGWEIDWLYRVGAGLHVTIAAAIFAIGFSRPVPRPVEWAQDLYPLLLLLLFYWEADLYVKLLHEAPGYDALVRSWDLMLFGGHPHTYLPTLFEGRMWQEIFHFLYVSYFLLLIWSFLAVWTWWPRHFPRFSFVVTGMFLSFTVVYMLFPVAGPLIRPYESISTTGIFPKLVAWLYVPLRMDGIHTGAFPSSHVGMSVGIVFLLGRLPWIAKLGLWGLVVGIAVSTVYGPFHYAVDAVAGAVSGAILYVLWNALYTRIEAV